MDTIGEPEFISTDNSGQFFKSVDPGLGPGIDLSRWSLFVSSQTELQFFLSFLHLNTLKGSNQTTESKRAP